MNAPFAGPIDFADLAQRISERGELSRRRFGLVIQDIEISPDHGQLHLKIVPGLLIAALKRVGNCAVVVGPVVVWSKPNCDTKSAIARSCHRDVSAPLRLDRAQPRPPRDGVHKMATERDPLTVVRGGSG